MEGRKSRDLGSTRQNRIESEVDNRGDRALQRLSRGFETPVGVSSGTSEGLRGTTTTSSGYVSPWTSSCVPSRSRGEERSWTYESRTEKNTEFCHKNKTKQETTFNKDQRERTSQSDDIQRDSINFLKEVWDTKLVPNGLRFKELET